MSVLAISLWACVCLTLVCLGHSLGSLHGASLLKLAPFEEILEDIVRDYNAMVSKTMTDRGHNATMVPFLPVSLPELEDYEVHLFRVYFEEDEAWIRERLGNRERFAVFAESVAYIKHHYLRRHLTKDKEGNSFDLALTKFADWLPSEISDLFNSQQISLDMGNKDKTDKKGEKGEKDKKDKKNTIGEYVGADGKARRVDVPLYLEHTLAKSEAEERKAKGHQYDQHEHNQHKRRAQDQTNQRKRNSSLNWATGDNPYGRTIVSDIHNQGDCGACWSFAATSAIEAQVFRSTADVDTNTIDTSSSSSSSESGSTIRNSNGDINIRSKGTRLGLSAQELIDCDVEFNRGCMGGNPLFAYQYTLEYGLTSEQAYPFIGRQHTTLPSSPSSPSSLSSHASSGSGPRPQSRLPPPPPNRNTRVYGNSHAPGCRREQKVSYAAIEGYLRLPGGNPALMRHTVESIGPVSTGICATDPSFLLYFGGIYNPRKGNPYYDILNHMGSGSGSGSNAPPGSSPPPLDPLSSCCTTQNHAVLLVGFGQEGEEDTDTDTYTGTGTTEGEGEREGGQDYWVLQNSWSEMWGEGGYMRLAMEGGSNSAIQGSQGGLADESAGGKPLTFIDEVESVFTIPEANPDTCGVASFPSVPIRGVLLPTYQAYLAREHNEGREGGVDGGDGVEGDEGDENTGWRGLVNGLKRRYDVMYYWGVLNWDTILLDCSILLFVLSCCLCVHTISTDRVVKDECERCTNGGYEQIREDE